MRLRPWILGALFGAAALFALPLSGVIPQGVGALGPLAEGYRWIAVRQAVTLRSLFLSAPPDLGDHARAARAAGHYQMACRVCHGAPGAPPEAFAPHLTPVPPPLAGASQWRPPARVFVTLRDGVAHSAMPAWPSRLREDEIWDMVSFLSVLPALTPPDYEALAGDASCESCHQSGRAGIPRLDLQTPEYLATQLRAYRIGQRASGTMQAAAAGLDDAEIEALARKYGQARPEAAPASRAETPAPAEAPPPARSWRQATPTAADLAQFGDPARDIPACLSCHGASARGDYPRLAGQEVSYLQAQLALFAKLGPDRGGPHAALMAPIAKALLPSEYESLARYLSQMAPP